MGAKKLNNEELLDKGTSHALSLISEVLCAAFDTVPNNDRHTAFADALKRIESSVSGTGIVPLDRIDILWIFEDIKRKAHAYNRITRLTSESDESMTRNLNANRK